MKKKNNFFLQIGWAIIVIITIVIIWNHPSETSGFTNGYFTNLPNYFVFIATSVSALLLFTTLTNQRKANQVAAFENRFFKFIDYHRENVSQMRIKKYSNIEESDYLQGIQVFTVLHYQIKGLLKEFFQSTNNKNPNFEQKKAAVDFIYLCIFFGAGEDGQEVLKSHYKADHFDNIEFLEKKIDKHNCSNKNESEDDSNEVYYSGNAGRLGRYFRNIFQAIKYVDGQKFLNEREKYDYVKIFRAQMSVHEQIIFFYNSISRLGESWEIEEYTNENPNEEEKRKKSYSNLLITKYDLIRNSLFNNINLGNIERISIKEFYPLLNLELEEESSVYGILPYKNNGKTICRFCFNKKYIGYKNKEVQEKIKKHFTRMKLDNKEIISNLESFSCDEYDCVSKPTIEILKMKFKQNLN